MESVTKKRIIFWSIILVIMVVFYLVGKSKYNEGYGKIGKIRKELMPIAEKFNSLDYVIRYGGLKAEVSGDKLKVIYDSNGTKEKLTCKYKNENNKEILTCDATNVLNDAIMLKGIIDAVFINNGNNGSVFSTYNYKDFSKINIEDGVHLTLGNTNKLEIDINTKVYNKLDELGLEELETTEITKKDLSNLNNELKTNNRFILNKNTKIIYIFEDEDNYIIYAQESNTNDNEKYIKSIKTIIAYLNEDAVDDVDINVQTINEEHLYSLVTINPNVGNKEMEDIFTSDSNIMKIVVKKAEEKNQEE